MSDGKPDIARGTVVAAVAVAVVSAGCDNLFFDPGTVPLGMGDGGDAVVSGDTSVDGTPAADSGEGGSDSGGLDSAGLVDAFDVDAAADTGVPDPDTSPMDTASSDTQPRDTRPRDTTVADTGQDTSPQTKPFSCFRAAKCTSLHCPGYDKGCATSYRSMVPGRKRPELQAFVGCLSANHCDYIGQPSCAASRCHAPQMACVETAPPTGTLSCAGYYRCAALCNPTSTTCFDRCEQRLGFLAKQNWQELDRCIVRNCRGGANFGDCVRQNCKAKYDTCMQCSTY